jgi:hypothetical protein
MTNYKLEEFKAWLEERTNSHDQIIRAKYNLPYKEDLLVFLKDKGFEEYLDSGNLELNSVGVILTWQKECLQNQIQAKEVELATERETTQEALRTSQEWHERQKAEIITQKDQAIAEWKNKYQSLIQQRKTQIQQEITLLKKILAIN